MQNRTPIDAPLATGDLAPSDSAGVLISEIPADSQRSDSPLATPLLPVADAADRPSHVNTAFHLGDLVEIDRNGVNCRAWMSKLAPVRCKLRKGTRATLLSEPFRFGHYEWAKLRVHESGIQGCLSTRYLALVEPAAPLGSAAIDSTDRAVGQPDDALITLATLNLRSRPGIDAPVVELIAANTLGVILDAPVVNDDIAWLPVRFRADSGWVAARHTMTFVSTGKWIEVDLSAQRLTAWQAGDGIRRFTISSGKRHFATPAGAFTIREKIPVRVLRGSVRGEDWKIPGVPWIMVFKRGGFYIHAVYWHNDFGQPASHGCVTLAPEDAEWLYDWTPLDTPVWIHA